MKEVKVAIYARVSTIEQAEEGYSIEAQVEAIKSKCKLEGKAVVAVYEDRGISGKSIANRLELQKMLADSKVGLFNEVIVWKTSRLARNILDLLQIVKILEENKVSFKSISEPYDTSTPTGKLMMSMLASVAEFERTTIIENVKMGMNARANQGYKNGGKMLGYRSVGSGKESKLEIEPKEAEIVRKIYKLYLEGLGYKAIANKLNKEGYRTVKGNLFGITGISDILSNPTYVGKIRFNYIIDWSNKRRSGKNENYIIVDGLHEPIISKKVWERAQKIRETRADKYPRSYSGEFPLTGIMKCPVCGDGMVAARTTNTLKDGTKRKIRYYSCGRFRNKGSVACSANSVRAEEAEKYVFDKIKKLITNEKVLKDIVKNLNKSRQEVIKPLEQEKAEIENKIKNYTERKKRVFELYEGGELEKEILKERLIQIDETIEQLQSNMIDIVNKLKINSSDEIPYALVKEVMKDFNKVINSAEKNQRKMFLQLIINKITIGEDRKVESIDIHFNETLINIIKSFLGEESSDNEDSSSSFVFAIAL